MAKQPAGHANHKCIHCGIIFYQRRWAKQCSKCKEIRHSDKKKEYNLRQREKRRLMRLSKSSSDNSKNAQGNDTNSHPVQQTA